MTVQEAYSEGRSPLEVCGLGGSPLSAGIAARGVQRWSPPEASNRAWDLVEASKQRLRPSGGWPGKALMQDNSERFGAI